MTAKAVTEDVKDRLVAVNSYVFGGTAAWALFIAVAPDKGANDKVITLIDSVTQRPDYFQNRALKPLRYEHIQIQVRGRGYSAVQQKCETIKDQIVAWARFTTADGMNYKGIFPESDPFWLEQDDKLRYIWVVNFRAVREDRS